MPQFQTINGRVLHYAFRDGDRTRRAIVFTNSLGTDLRLWDAVLASLPKDVPVLRIDKRGHGLSADGPISIALLAEDTAALMDHFGLARAVVCGVSVGGMIAQALAVARPDLVSAAIFSNTGMTIGTADNWNQRIDTVRRDGIASIADAIVERWFSPDYMARDPDGFAGYRAMLVRTPAEGYARVCEAIRDADLTATAADITQPVICIAGEQDKSTPPEVVRTLAAALPDARFTLLPGVGHLPCIEQPGAILTALADLGAI